MPNTHDYGDLVKVSVTFRNASDNTVMDPDVVKLTYRKPGGTVVTLVYLTDAALVKDSTGVYHADLGANESGQWYYRWWSTGDGQAADEGTFEIKSSQAITPTISDEQVPASRTFALARSDDGLTAASKSFAIGTTTTLAVDFAADLPANGRVTDADAPTIHEGTAGGVTFGDVGPRHTKSQFRITFVTAGAYDIDVPVTYDSAATSLGRITVNVVQ